jgi:hypothetical protein
MRREEITMTEERRRRIRVAMIETQTTIDRAMRYSPEFRDHKLIATYQQHLTNLQSLLNGERTFLKYPEAATI